MNKIVIFRAVSGAGKSTAALALQAKLNAANKLCPIVSADYTFLQDGVYKFEASRLGEAHGACFRDAITLVRSWHNNELDNRTLIIDNTNISVAEIAPYVALAQAYGCDHEIITILVDPATAALRNVHGVPFDRVMAMHDAMLSTTLMPWWIHTQVTGS